MGRHWIKKEKRLFEVGLDLLFFEEVIFSVAFQAFPLEVDGRFIDAHRVETRLEPGSSPSVRQLATGP
jgi:hypothetical protein